MADKKKVTININEINVFIDENEQQDKVEIPHPLQSMMKQIKEVGESIKLRLATTLSNIHRATDEVKNDQDFRVLIRAILDKNPDVVLETPEATAFLKGLMERDFFKKEEKTKEQKEKEASSQNGL